MTNAAVALVAAGICGCGWLRFIAVLKNLYDWLKNLRLEISAFAGYL